MGSCLLPTRPSQECHYITLQAEMKGHGLHNGCISECCPPCTGHPAASWHGPSCFILARALLLATPKPPDTESTAHSKQANTTRSLPRNLHWAAKTPTRSHPRTIVVRFARAPADLGQQEVDAEGPVLVVEVALEIVDLCVCLYFDVIFMGQMLRFKCVRE